MIREVVGALAIAVQRGNAMAFLEGYDRALHEALAVHTANAGRSVKKNDADEEDTMGAATTESDEDDESGGEQGRDSDEAEV